MISSNNTGVTEIFCVTVFPDCNPKFAEAWEWALLKPKAADPDCQLLTLLLYTVAVGVAIQCRRTGKVKRAARGRV